MFAIQACVSSSPPQGVDPAFLDVKLGSVETGSAEAPRAFSASGVAIPVTARALDRGGDPYPHTGPLKLTARPGGIDGSLSVDMVDGLWEGTVSVRAAFGPMRIWLSDEDTTEGRAASWATGVTEAVWFLNPTIAEMQDSADHETNNLAGEYAEMRVSDRQVVVTALDKAGFWITDLADGAGAYNSLYVYTFQKPADEVVVGARIDSLTGINQEYLASTQLSFPALTVAADEALAVPGANLLSASQACDNAAMEKLEASRVRAESVTISSSFAEGSTEFSDFETYGQWPMQLGDCTIYAESATTVPDWYPPDHAGETLSFVDGMLKEVYGKWILVVLDADGIAGASG